MLLLASRGLPGSAMSALELTTRIGLGAEGGDIGQRSGPAANRGDSAPAGFGCRATGLGGIPGGLFRTPFPGGPDVRGGSR